ncbi:MAG: hypothetical protein AB7P69_03620 [Candidatus Binatia bacterium]
MLSLFALLNWWTSAAVAQDKGQGTLVISVNKKTDQQSEVGVSILTQDTKALVATAHLGVPVHLPAGTYRIEFVILGGQVTRENVLVKTGRTSTVIISNVAALRVNVLDTNGNDLGIGVEVYDSAIGQQLGAFLSGETILSRPGVVDVKIAVPPQSQWIRKVELQANALAYFDFHQQAQSELVVRPTLNGRDASAFTQVIISIAGENKELARSEPGQVHRFGLTSGTYDILVMNPTGSGKPFVQDRVELKGEGLTEKDVPLDKERVPSEAKKAQTL